jgi:DNA-binding NarL/FixJ family response regulator
MKTRIVLVDDHEVVRVGLRALLESEEDFLVVGEAADGTLAVSMAATLQPHVVVMDVRMGEKDGIETCREIKERFPAIAVLMLTSFASDEGVLAALVAGASGFLVKNTGRSEIVKAIRAVAMGHSLLDPTVTKRVIERVVASVSDSTPAELAELSAREREVLARLAQGDSNRQIANHLVISEATARHHVSSVLAKLGLSRRSEAAALAVRLRFGSGEVE